MAYQHLSLGEADTVYTQAVSEATINLKSYPDAVITVPPGATVHRQTPIQRQYLTYSELVTEYSKAIEHTLTLHEAERGHDIDDLLLLLPDKTRTQVASKLLLDSLLACKDKRPDLHGTILLGLGTHPLMSEKDIQQMIGTERYWDILEAEFFFRQQSTKAVTNEMTPIKVWSPADCHDCGYTDWPALLAHLSSLKDTLEPSPLTQRCQVYIELAGVIAQAHLAELRAVFETLLAAGEFVDIVADSRSRRINAQIQGQLEGLKRVTIAKLTLSQERQASQADVALFISSDRDNPLRLRWGSFYLINVPARLLRHQMVFVAGDVKVHPYEGRYGSGGINKMLAVGVCSMNEIRRSHSTSMLMHADTRAGNGKSPFVQWIEMTARNIKEVMLHKRNTDVLTAPYCLSVMGKSLDRIWGVAWGQDEAARAPLGEELKQAYTLELDDACDVLISDLELHKATDITAGARSVQYVCDWHDPANPLLAERLEDRVVLLFNPCNENLNNSGIGNDGTKQQLDVLLTQVTRRAWELGASLGACQSPDAVETLLLEARAAVLSEWKHHLITISEADRIFAELSVLALAAQRPDNPNATAALRDLMAALHRYSQGHNDVNRAVQSLLSLATKASDSKLLAAIEQTSQHFAEHEGLGEGGQRALRLLKICQTFGVFCLATDNVAVIDYLQHLDPDLTGLLSEPLQQYYRRSGQSARILGLVPLNLNHMSHQAAVDLAIAIGELRCQRPPRVSILTEPLILKRRQAIPAPARTGQHIG